MLTKPPSNGICSRISPEFAFRSFLHGTKSNQFHPPWRICIYSWCILQAGGDRDEHSSYLQVWQQPSRALAKAISLSGQPGGNPSPRGRDRAKRAKAQSGSRVCRTGGHAERLYVPRAARPTTPEAGCTMKTRYMLDTNMCIYIAKHRPPEVRARFERLKPGQLVMSAITYGELYYGASKSSQQAKALAQLQELVQDIPVEELDSRASEAYGEIRATLEKEGRLIGNNDLWIGAHALALNLTLATNNEREFKRIPGLLLENWTK